MSALLRPANTGIDYGARGCRDPARRDWLPSASSGDSARGANCASAGCSGAVVAGVQALRSGRWNCNSADVSRAHAGGGDVLRGISRSSFLPPRTTWDIDQSWPGSPRRSFGGASLFRGYRIRERPGRDDSRLRIASTAADCRECAKVGRCTPWRYAHPKCTRSAEDPGRYRDDADHATHSLHCAGDFRRSFGGTDSRPSRPVLSNFSRVDHTTQRRTFFALYRLARSVRSRAFHRGMR